MPTLPDRFGPFGGRYVAELLVPALQELEHAWAEYRKDEAFQTDLAVLLRDYAGRPSPLYLSPALSERLGCRTWLKREDLLHGGAHKINNTLGQALLAKAMGKTRLIAETGAGQHGVATAMAGAVLDLPVRIYMGAVDLARQGPNVQRMELLGAEVVAVDSGTSTLKDAINEALRHWTSTVVETFYVFGTAAGPHPYPLLVRDLQRVIGDELRAQMLDRVGALPTHLLACVGGGSNAIGAFAAFLDDTEVTLIGVEPGGEGLESGRHGATLCKGRPGALHGAWSYLLQNDDGQVQEAHSISAGLDYPGVGPEHAWLKESGRASYVSVTDAEAVEALTFLTRNEGIIPALESSHAIAHALRLAESLSPEDRVVVNLSGRGDKDLAHVQSYLERT